MKQIDKIAEKLILVLKVSNYLELMTIAAALFSLILVYREKDFKQYKRVFLLYLYGVAVLLIFSLLVYSVPWISFRNSLAIGESLNASFNIIELYVFYYFFKQELHSISTRKNLTTVQSFLFPLFILATIFYFLIALYNPYNINSFQILKSGELLCIVNLFALIYPSFCYFLEVFRENEKFNFHISITTFVIFSYSILGILSFSLSKNLEIQPFYRIKHFIVSLHPLLLAIVCLTLAYLYRYYSRNPQKIS